MTARIPGTLLAVVLATFAGSCSDRTPSHPTGRELFLGQIAWNAVASGTDQGAVSQFRALSVHGVRAWFGPSRIRLEISGGLSHGVLLVDRTDRLAVRLDPKQKVRERARSLRPLTGTWNRVESVHLAALANRAPTEILGHPVEGFRVLDPRIAPKGTTVRVWVARDILLPPTGFLADFDRVRLRSPDPLAVPVGPGAVLREEMVGDGITVTWTATEVKAGRPDPALFSAPEGYAEK